MNQFLRLFSNARPSLRATSTPGTDRSPSAQPFGATLRSLSSLTLIVAATALTLGVTGCASTDDGGPRVTSPGSDGEAMAAGESKPMDSMSGDPEGGKTVRQGPASGSTASGEPEGGSDELMRDLKLRGEQRRAASAALTRQAESLMSELNYELAERKLEEAVRLDGENAKARELLDRVLFIVGDLRGQYRDGGRLQIETERVRRQQAILELRQMLVKAERAKQDGNYDEAVQTFDRLLDRVNWFPFNYDITDIRTAAEVGKTDSDRLAQLESQSERRELERTVRDRSEVEQARSLKFVRNRVERLTERMERNYDDRDYEESISLAEKILDLDRTNENAKDYRNRAVELRHLYRKLTLAARQDDEWERTFLSQYESEIPYHAIFNFPDRDTWKEVSRKSLSIARSIRKPESNQEAEIRRRLQLPTDVDFPPEQPFQAAIDFLQEVSQINFVLTKSALEALEESQSPVRLAPVKGLSVKNVLELILSGRDPKFSYVIRNGAIVIGPAEGIRADIHRQLYEVQDLISSPPDFKAPKLALDESEGDAGGGGGGSVIDLGGDDDEDTSSTAIGTDLLKELVEKALYPAGEESDEAGEVPEGESVEIQNKKLVVRTTYENHDKVDLLLASLRKSTGVMVTVESRFLDLQDNFLQSIGIDFGNPFASNLPNPISDIDGNGTQISPGYEFVDAQGQTNLRGAVYNEFSQPLGSQVAPFQLQDTGGFALQYNVLDNYILEAVLEANAKTQEFSKLDAPRVTAFNGQISHSLVIDQAAYIKDAEVNQTGVVPVINPVIGILNSGSILQVRPTVSFDRKYVILEIEPTLAVQLPSRFKRLTLNLTNLDVEFPVLSVTKIKTTITVPDGGTVLVGGLKRTITQKQQVGAPWVTHIPVVNLLFGRKGESRLQSNLFVLINAQITVVRDEEAAIAN